MIKAFEDIRGLLVVQRLTEATLCNPDQIGRPWILVDPPASFSGHVPCITPIKRRIPFLTGGLTRETLGEGDLLLVQLQASIRRHG